MIASASGRSHPRSAGFMPARPGRGGSQCIVNTADAAIDAARAGLGITKALSYRLRLALRRQPAPYSREFRTRADPGQPAAP